MFVALLSAPWSKIRDNEAQHIFLGSVVMLSLLWVMRGGIQDGLSFHLLGMTLMCGRRGRFTGIFCRYCPC